jgi:hypothetical protein
LQPKARKWLTQGTQPLGEEVDIPIGRTHISHNFASIQMKTCDAAACHPPQSFPMHTNPISADQSFGFGFVA